MPTRRRECDRHPSHSGKAPNSPAWLGWTYSLTGSIILTIRYIRKIFPRYFAVSSNPDPSESPYRLVWRSPARRQAGLVRSGA